MKKIFLLLVCVMQLMAIELSDIAVERNSTVEVPMSVRVFGQNLFNGSFSHKSQLRYNPEYRINIGDTILVKIWGAINLELKTTVDSQGNIFIPQVGTVNVLGIRNDKLSSVIQTAVKKVFKQSVYVYADLASYQPVSVFVTGAVNKPGLYEGLSSDSVIQFLDKARGINPNAGSFRHIKILRDNKVLKSIDLYRFLLNGKMELFQFHMGDVIVVEPVQSYIDVTGDVKRPYRYELIRPSISIRELLQVVLPNPTTTNFTVSTWRVDNKQEVAIYSIKDNLDFRVKAGQSVHFMQDHNAQSIEIKVAGEHEGLHNLVVKKGTSLQEVFEQLHFSKFSDPAAFQLYRKSIAAEQKKLIDQALDDLEAKALTTGSASTEEAIMRKQEAALVLKFIERARKIQPKGRVVINKDTNLSQVVLEDQDTIFIPKKSRMILVEGEVLLPGAQTYVDGMSFDDYIEACGGFNYRANKNEVLIIHKNGSATKYDADSWFTQEVVLQPGDAVLVLGKVDTKYLQAVKDITQIIYQIAVGAAVVLRY